MITRRPLRLLCLFALLLMPPLLASPPALADRFVAGTEDLPLMPELQPIAGSALSFDKPQGRIVEARAKGKVTRAAVLRFYAQTLPQLGWQPAGRNAWQREGEKLQLDFHGQDGALTVGFTLAPR
jgi:hypothetical protein